MHWVFIKNNIFFRYLFLEGKRSVKVFFRSIGNLLLVLVLTILAAVLLENMLSKNQIIRQVEIGIVMPEEKKLQQVTQFISAMESVRELSDFCYMELEEALEALEEGKLQAVLYLPDNFYEDIYYGVNTPATIFFPKETMQETQVFKELLTDGVALLQTAEAGVYATLDTARYYEPQIKRSKIGNKIAYRYIKLALKRDEVFEKRMLSPFGTVNMQEYYISFVLVTVLMMAGLNYSFLYSGKERAVEEKLRLYGLNYGKQAVIKLFIMTGILWVIGVLLYLAGCVANAWLELSLLWFEPVVLWKLLGLAFTMALYFHIVYSLVGAGIQGAAILFIINITMLIASGAILPAAYLPEVVNRLGQWLPVNYWNQYCMKMLF